MSSPARRVETFGTTIFTEINELAQQYQALNLGQGKPDLILHLILLSNWWSGGGGEV